MTAYLPSSSARRSLCLASLLLLLLGLPGCEDRSPPEDRPGTSEPLPTEGTPPPGPIVQEEPAPGTVRIAAFNVHRLFDTVCESGTCGGSAYEELPSPEAFTSRAVRLAQAIAALKALKSMAAGRRTWAVLGGMGELGDGSVDEHVRVGEMVVRLGVSRLLTVGALAKPIFDTFLLEGSLPDDACHVDDVASAISHLQGALREGDVVLVKASRAAGLERVALALTPDPPAPGGPSVSPGGPS